EISGPPKFVRIDPKEVKKDTSNIDSIVEVTPNSSFLSYLQTNTSIVNSDKCVNQLYNQTPTTEPTLKQITPENSQDCYLINQTYGSFQNLFEANKNQNGLVKKPYQLIMKLLPVINVIPQHRSTKNFL
ncbi:MAG: hypothetical protein HC932_04095, partial [Thermales bacterium]|nr:hypothetical protein [Thermales bacterium]